MIGSWMQTVAVAWLVFRSTGSGFYLGLAGGLSTLPSVFMAPIAGVLADRFDRRRIVMATQVLTALQATVLALLVVSNTASVTILFVISVITGLIQGFDWPTRQSLMGHLVDEQADLGNAIALNSTVFNLARAIGPTLAGAILATGGDALCFFLNAVCCGLALTCLARVRTRTEPPASRKLRFLREMSEGAAYIWKIGDIRRGILLVALASGCIMPYAALLPLFATKLFGGSAELFAALSAAPAIGAIGGGLLLASRRNPAGLSKQIRIVGLLASVSLIVFAISRWLPLSILALIFLGCAMMLWTSSLNTQLQTTASEKMRGRVMSFFSVALMGALPLGYFAYGISTSYLGAAATVEIGGAAALVGNLWLHRKSFRDPVFLLRRRTV